MRQCNGRLDTPEDAQAVTDQDANFEDNFCEKMIARLLETQFTV